MDRQKRSGQPGLASVIRRPGLNLHIRSERPSLRHLASGKERQDFRSRGWSTKPFYQLHRKSRRPCDFLAESGPTQLWPLRTPAKKTSSWSVLVPASPPGPPALMRAPSKNRKVPRGFASVALLARPSAVQPRAFPSRPARSQQAAEARASVWEATFMHRSNHPGSRP